MLVFLLFKEYYIYITALALLFVLYVNVFVENDLLEGNIYILYSFQLTTFSNGVHEIIINVKSVLKILTNKWLTVYINMYMHNNVALNIDFLL